MTSIESVFLLGSRTVRHGEPDMTKTYAELVNELHTNGLFREQGGRTSVKEMMDAFRVGLDIIEDKGVDCDNDSSETIAHFDEDDLNVGIDID